MDLREVQEFPYARLVYLIIQHRVVIPNKIAKWVPGGEWFQQLAVNPASFSNGDAEHVLSLYDQGAQLGLGTREELAGLLGEYVDILLSNSEISWQDRADLYYQLQRIGGATAEDLDYQEFDLSDPGKDAPLVKWMSGFEPLDTVTGGLYQGIWTVIAPPGAGKTSLLLTLAEELRTNQVCESILMVQTEIPGALIRARMQPMFKRMSFRKEVDKLIVASWTPGDILAWVEQNPQPDRVIILDSIDPPLMGAGEGTRHLLAAAYRDLIALKQKCLAVFVATWPKRGERILSLESGSEGASKERFSDGVIGITSAADRVRLTVLKNRFGQKGNAVTFKYDWGELTWGYDEAVRELNEREEDW